MYNDEYAASAAGAAAKAGMLAPFDAAVSLSGYAYNLFFVTLGNIVGAVLFLSIPYGIGALKK